MTGIGAQQSTLLLQPSIRPGSTRLAALRADTVVTTALIWMRLSRPKISKIATLLFDLDARDT